MKRFYLLACLLALASFAFAQQTYYYGLNGKVMNVFVDGENKTCLVTNTIEHGSPVVEARIGWCFVIVAVDGKPVDKDVWQELKQKPEVTLTIKELGLGQQRDVLIKGLPVQADVVAHEMDYMDCDLASKSITEVTERAFDKEAISIMSDPEVDFFAYSTFDFEFTDNNALQQKEIASEIEGILDRSTSLARDRENPDILVFIEYYSDRSERYVPPAQELRTRYNTRYNFYTKRYETLQYMETQTSRGYTETAYFTKLTISMADAKKMREGTASQSAIWQAEYGVSSGTKPDHKKFGKEIGFAMLAGFPFVPNRIDYSEYWFTGILYDGHTAGKVAGVIPGSPADKAGIEAGYVIQKCSYDKNDIFKKSFAALLEKHRERDMYYCDYEIFDFTRRCGLRLGQYDNGFKNGTSSPFLNTYMSTYKAVLRYGPRLEYVSRDVDYDKKPLVFTVKDGKRQTLKMTVRPEKKSYYFFHLQ
jgi:hypothetical protein